jgi:AraC-like DNA-binding protein
MMSTPRVRTAVDVPPGERAEYWRRVLCDGLAPHEVMFPEHIPLRGRVTDARVGLLLIRDVRWSAVRMARTTALIRRFDPELVHLSVQVTGRTMVELDDGTRIPLSPGDLILCDTSRPAVWEVPATSRLQRVVLPRALLPLSRAAFDHAVILPVSGRSGPGSVLAALVRELASHPGDDDLSVNVSLSVAVVDMMAAIFTTRPHLGQALPSKRYPAGVLRQVKAFIELNLPDPDLSPSSVAAAHHISLRHLQNLFASEHDTVAAWIRRRRLERCRADLLAPTMVQQPVSFIGARWGYLSPVTFSRAFRAHYGMPPKAYRTAHTPPRAR